MKKPEEPLPPPPVEESGPDSDAGDDHGPSDDEGPAGPQPEPDAFVARHPDAVLRNIPGGAPGRLAVHEVILSRHSKFLAAPARGLPKPEQILARTTQNLDTAEYLETDFVTIGKSAEELSKPLPLKARLSRATCGRCFTMILNTARPMLWKRAILSSQMQP